MWLVLALLAPLQDGDFGEILRRFEADEPAVRERASKDLDAFVRKLGSGAAEFLRRKLSETQGEARGRLQDQLTLIERVEKARRILRPLEALDVPDLSARKLVLYNPGTIYSVNSESTFGYSLGWLMEESAEKVRLLSLELGTTEHSRKFEPPRNWEEQRKKHPKNRPLPLEMIEIDFNEACARICDPTPVDSQNDPYDNQLGPASSWRIDAALMALAALQRGQERKAFELLEAHEASLPRDREDDKRAYPEILADLVCGQLRHAAVVSAEPRPAILKRWRKVHELLPGHREGEAAKMIPLYEKLIEQDNAWKEPAPGSRKTAEYWIHHLRDVAARQWSDPGSCDILQRWAPEEQKKPYPPEELLKLGWEAIPALIDHLDDLLPTRSVGWHRSFNRDSYYLLRIGDCCQQLLTAITGVSIYERKSTSGAMVKDGDADTAKARALQWWTEHGKSGAEAYYLDALAKADHAAFAATKLLAMDSAKHLPKLVALLEKGPPDVQRAVLDPVGPFLRPEHEKLLDPFLTDADPQGIATATRVLWQQFRSDRGALELIRRLSAVPEDDQDSPLVWSATWTLRSMRTEPVARGLVELMGSKHTRVRMDAFQVAGEFPHPLLAKAMIAHLEDRTLTGWSSHFPIRFRDQAAWGLIRMAGLGERFELKGSEGERDRTIADLQAWWTQDGPAVDWAALRKKLEESEKPKPPAKD